MVWEGDEGEVEDLAVVVAEESALAGQRSPEVLQELLQEVPSGTLTKVCFVQPKITKTLM